LTIVSHILHLSSTAGTIETPPATSGSNRQMPQVTASTEKIVSIHSSLEELQFELKLPFKSSNLQ
jgi:hypothetical protein